MADKAWKREERVVAEMFGTVRRLMKGTDEKSDVVSDKYCVDAKLRKRWEVEKWFKELGAAAKKENQVPVLVLRKPGSRLRLAVVDAKFLTSLLQKAGLL